MSKFFLRFKSFIIVFCIVAFLPFTYLNTKRAEAFSLPEAFVIAGGIAVAPETLGAIAIGGLACYGLYVASPYIGDFKSYLEGQFASLATGVITDYFQYYQDSSGKDYAGLTSDGLGYVKSLSDSYSGSGQVSVSHSQSTSNTISGTKNPYMANGYYMTPYLVNSSGYVYDKFSIYYGDSVYFQTRSVNSSSYSTGSFKPTSDCYIRVYQESGYVDIQYSYNSTSWGTMYHYPTSANVYFDFGYYTTSNTVAVPASDVIQSGDVVNVGDGAAVAVPISGQYDSSGNKYYEGIEGSSAGVVSGLTAKTGTNTGTGSGTGAGTGTGTDASFWDQLWDWLKKIYDGICSIPDALAGLPADIASAIGSLLQSLFVPSDTFFTDEFNKMKAPIINSFPNDLNVLNSLNDNSFEFDDIHISYSPFSGLSGIDAVIVSASTVHQYIDYIRGATSCLWVFLLLLYIWRKINYFFSGNEIIQPTIYSGHGGGGYRRSSKGDGGS